MENAVIVFDEAHNIEDICEELASLSVKSGFLSKVKEVFQFIYTTTDLNSNEIQLFLKKVDRIMLEIDMFLSKMSETLKGKYQLILTKDDLKNFLKDVFSESFFLITTEKIIESLQNIETPRFHLRAILKFMKLLWKISFIQKKFETNSDDTQHFAMSLEPIFSRKLQDYEIKLSIFCFDPSVIFRKIQQENIKCLFLTSGTLAPFDLYESRMRTHFPIKVLNPHTIDTKTNLCASIIRTGIHDKPLDFSMRNRSGPFADDLALELGESLLKLFETIPNGKLVFFTSFSYMQTILSFWKTGKGNQIFQRLQEMTEVFVEEKTNNKKNKNKKEKENEESKEEITILQDSEEKKGKEIEQNQDFYQNFFKAASKERGAALFGVLRGKGSEGVDFIDTAARGVFIIGIPFPPFKDIKIVLKKKYLDEIKKKSPENASGQLWYELQAVKSINQGIGRVVRHRDDYGVIGLLDYRYDQRSSIKENISDWAKSVMGNSRLKNFLARISMFFKKKNEVDMNILIDDLDQFSFEHFHDNK